MALRRRRTTGLRSPHPSWEGLTTDGWAGLTTDGWAGLSASSDASYAVTYTYDPAGNRTLRIDSGVRTTYAYDAGDRLLSGHGPAGTVTYTYDADGHRTVKDDPSAGPTYYGWDARGRMASAEPPAGEVVFSYDAAGRRVEKATPSETVRFVRDLERVLLETDADWATTRGYTAADEGYGNLVSEHGPPADFPCNPPLPRR